MRRPRPEGRPMIVDAHQHFWDPSAADYPWLTDELAALRRRFGPDDLRPLLARTGVDRTVLVQTRSSIAETRDFLSTAAGWRPPRRPPPPGPRRARPSLAEPSRGPPRDRRRGRCWARLRPSGPTARASRGARRRPRPAGRPICHRPPGKAADPRRRSPALGGPDPSVRRAPERLVQGLRAGHRGGLGPMAAG